MATIYDVAKKVGLSVTTVSRVLNNRGYISEATRKRVYETMEELNYQPNELARSLLRKQSNVLGRIIPDVALPCFSELASHMEACAYASGYKILLCNSHLDPDKERDYIDMLKRNRVDGIIMGSHTLEVDEYRTLQRPLVTIDRMIDASIPYIASDNYLGGRLATQLLLDKGCRKLAHICGNLALDLLANQRDAAYVEAAAAGGVEALTYETGTNVFDEGEYRELVKQLFAEHPEVDGIFAGSDLMAAFVLQECARRGRSVPDQVKLVGYDDVPMASWFVPSITSIRQPIRQMGELAVELLLKQLAGEEVPPATVLPVELMERETT